MKNWHEYTNYRKSENPDGSYSYIVTVDGEDVEVSEELYKEYSRSSRKMKYMELDLKRDRVRKDGKSKVVLDAHGQPVMLPELEMSLCKLIEEDWEFRSPEPLTEDAVIARIEFEVLHNVLNLLTAEERALIDALFFDGLTEREYAAISGFSQKTVNNRKHKILDKLRTLM